MARPSRPSGPEQSAWQPRTFFVTTGAAGGRHLFQSTRMAGLLIDVLRTCVKARRFTVHDFVVMPNHVHILITVPADVSIEKAMQWMKGGFSFRAKKELGFAGEIWQRGFSDVRILDELSMREHQTYIESNPVKAGLAASAEAYPFCTAYLKKMREGSGAKAQMRITTLRHG